MGKLGPAGDRIGIEEQVHQRALALLNGGQKLFHPAALARTLAAYPALQPAASAEALVLRAQALGAQARMVADADAAVPHCPLIAVCTPAHSVVLSAPPRPDAFVAAVGAFTPAMAELAPAFCRHVAAHGHIVVDSEDARHEAGDLLQAGLDVGMLPTLREALQRQRAPSAGPVLFKSCGWAGWDLAAARLALRAAS